MSATPLISGIAALADRYDGFILDIWGVLHDGRKPYPGVAECLAALRAAGKRTCLLSNAPRRSEVVVDSLAANFGIARQAYDLIYTSGEAVHEHLAARPDGWYRGLGRRLYQIGPPRDASVFAGLDYRQVEQPAEADFVVATGISSPDETLEHFEADLQACAGHRLPMICANPDLVVTSGTRLVLCAGSMARRYEELGGTVRYHGKPHAPVYGRCRELMGIADRQRIVAVGDGLRTDIAGANAAGLDSILITGGIHREELMAADPALPDLLRLAAIIESVGARPTYALPILNW